MSAERLREAADRLDALASHGPGASAPAVGKALAAWLRVTERDTGSSSTAYKAAEALADAILGDAS